ncbi:hypothetical protein [Streptomyces sp. NPDC059489]|uniref:hypothetical protein n=1 Tax=Streptomyces sp. NPDC059489 TaxID=3346849 RepID=UPI00368D6E36
MLRRLLEHCPELDRTHDLVRQLAAILDARDANALSDWLEQLTTLRLPALASLANAIPEDQPAVVQGITTPFSTPTSTKAASPPSVGIQRRV